MSLIKSFPIPYPFRPEKPGPEGGTKGGRNERKAGSWTDIDLLIQEAEMTKKPKKCPKYRK